MSALAATALNANAQGDDIAAGHSFAREACSACHMLDTQQHRPPWRIFIGPAFGNISNNRGMSATSLRVFLTTSYPKCRTRSSHPNRQRTVIAYILSLGSERNPES